jgi:hypothetical protein
VPTAEEQHDDQTWVPTHGRCTLIKDGKLVFDDADPTTLLKLHNEDLFRGGLTNEPYIVDRKARRA